MVTRCARVTSIVPALPGDRIGERDGDRAATKRGVEARELLRERREALVAGRVGRAAREHALERALRLDGDLRHERERRRHDAVEHDGARAVREAAHVVLRDARAVRAAEDVDLGVAERRAHGVEVADRDAGRVELRAGRGAPPGSRARARRARRAGSRRPRARRPAWRSRAGWNRPCRAGPPARGRVRGARRRRRRAAARSPGSSPGPGRPR